MSKAFSEVPGHPDAVKQELKEKEVLKEKDKEKDKEQTKETKDKHDKSEKHEKEKSEKDAKDKDHKDNKEAKEHKEHKDQKDQKDKPEKEHKDKLHHKDKAEPKEVLKEKEAIKDKEVHKDEEVQAAAKTFDKFHPEKFHKDFDKVRKDTPDKFTHPEVAAAKTFDKSPQEKFHKEHPEKVQKDGPDKLAHLEVAAAGLAAEPQAVAAQAGLKVTDKIVEKIHLEKTHKDKDFKFEKIEKFEKFEKIEIKEWEFQPGSIDPGGPVEQRLAALEATMAQLVHFIPANLRPDLTTGALVQEEDGKKPAGAKGAAAKPRRPARKRKPKP